MKTFEEVAKELNNDPTILTRKHKNVCELTGFIIRKPKFITHDITKIASCSFLLYQINKTVGGTDYITFSCLVFQDWIIEELKKLENVAYIQVKGKLMYSKKVSGMCLHVMDMVISHTYDIELAKEWERKK